MNPYQMALNSLLGVDDLEKISTSPLGNESARNNQQIAKEKVDQQANALDRVNEIRAMWAGNDISEKKKNNILVPSGHFLAPDPFRNPPPSSGGGMTSMWNTQTKTWESIPSNPGAKIFAGGWVDSDPQTGELKTEAYFANENINKNIQDFVAREGRFPTLKEHRLMNPLAGSIFGGQPFTTRQAAKHQDVTNILKAAGAHSETEAESKQREWEETPMHTGVGPLGAHGSYAESRKPDQNIINAILKARRR